MESILDSIKKQLGYSPEDTYYDPDIIMAINSVFSILNQLGAGPEDGFVIEDNTQLWSCYTTDNKLLNLIKPYVYLKTRLVFDPPLNSTIVELQKEQCKEYEFRINVLCDPAKNDEV